MLTAACLCAALSTSTPGAGMAFEPHLQNVYVAMRDGMPSRMILRDLDSTILDPRPDPPYCAGKRHSARARNMAAHAHLPPAADDWLTP